MNYDQNTGLSYPNPQDTSQQALGGAGNMNLPVSDNSQSRKRRGRPSQKQMAVAGGGFPGNQSSVQQVAAITQQVQQQQAAAGQQPDGHPGVHGNNPQLSLEQILEEARLADTIGNSVSQMHPNSLYPTGAGQQSQQQYNAQLGQQPQLPHGYAQVVGAPTRRKRTRTVTTPYQSRVLNKILSQTLFPSTDMREALAAALGMTPRAVQIWFQNQRAKIKNRERQEELGLGHLTGPGNVLGSNLLIQNMVGNQVGTPQGTPPQQHTMVGAQGQQSNQGATSHQHTSQQHNGSPGGGANSSGVKQQGQAQRAQQLQNITASAPMDLNAMGIQQPHPGHMGHVVPGHHY
ncbi:hypothetical protein BZG36_00332 [Bifiguratus adelaidae]|uniref:Homeobox domain-containing protein n=1 Tax=Bifiguratus adelaidae TaxID=1938954 RepID=A0A261Y7Q6_9FUNG|nr:hypothetical protein BZG36_00332 [Bifiguratus adelaidae]